jgi:GMC oxidoreductase
MAFQLTTLTGQCATCGKDFQNDAMGHEGECSSIHRRCLAVWIRDQKRAGEAPNCPICRLNITSVEDPKAAFVRMAGQGDLGSVKALIATYPSGDLSFLRAFMNAFEAGHLQVMEVLIENGSRWIDDDWYGIAIIDAAGKGCVENLEILLAHRGKRNLREALTLAGEIAAEREAVQGKSQELMDASSGAYYLTEQSSETELSLHDGRVWMWEAWAKKYAQSPANVPSVESAHHVGLTRMGDREPSQIFGVKNLYVADISISPFSPTYSEGQIWGGSDSSREWL